MKGRRWPRLLLIAALLGTYGYRSVEGIRAGWAFERGHLLRNLDQHRDAATHLEAAAVGANARRALLMAGEARLDLWDLKVERRGSLGANRDELVKAGADFLTCLCVAPAERGVWRGMGWLYDAVEWIGRERRAEQPLVSPEHPWERVGRAGRVAVGTLRLGLEAAPNWAQLHDRHALTLWNYGLDEPAREAVAASARALPIFFSHPYHLVLELPDWVEQEFARASREALGEVPLATRRRHLLDLGKLERRIGANERAIEALQEVLAAGGDASRRAEASFHLGLALAAADRHAEGRVHLNAARSHPVFRVSALRALANLAEEREEYELALDYRRQLRWEQPGELLPCLKFAAVAQRLGDWAAAFESLRWAKLKHPSDPRPYVALVEAYLATGDPSAASGVVNELREVVGPDAVEVIRLRRRIGGASRSENGSGS